MAAIPESFHDLFERKTFAHLATLLSDGTPQVTPVWVDHDAEREHLLVNTARGRRKERNVARDPKVGASMLDPDDPYRFLSVRGRVVDVHEDGAIEHVDALARRYMGVEEYPNHGDEEAARVVLEIQPEAVVTS